MSLKEKKSIHKGASPSFYFFKHYNGKINIAIKKTKIIGKGVLVFFDWFCCYFKVFFFLLSFLSHFLEKRT